MPSTQTKGKNKEKQIVMLIKNAHPPTEQLVCANCLDVLSEISDESIDLLITDPPYKITARGNAGNSGGMLRKDISLRGQVFNHNNIDCEEYAREFYRILKDGSHCYIMTNHINLIHMLNTFTDLRNECEKAADVKPYGFHFIKSLIWDKGNKIMGTFYMSQFEYILFFRKGKGVRIKNCGTSDILSVKNIKTKDAFGNNLHDTEKPVQLMKILVENSSNVGDVVIDPFMGIGSVGIACRDLGRKFIGVEIDEHYYSIAKNRINNGGE